jgi:hypothetical protein
MSISTKYGRTYHYDFSPGTTSDDRINRKWREDIQQFDTCVHTEKMDGENTCLSQHGVFARSHATPTDHSWADYLKIKQSQMVSDLKGMNMDIFGENLYAIHSIIYPRLEDHFYVFGVRVLDKWLSWEETKWYADLFDFKTVPALFTSTTVDTDLIEEDVLELSKEESVFGSLQNGTTPPLICTREGIVTRNIEEYGVEDFAKNVFKYVRANHVNTTTHWSNKIVRAKLSWEK